MKFRVHGITNQKLGNDFGKTAESKIIKKLEDICKDELDVKYLDTPEICGPTLHVGAVIYDGMGLEPSTLGITLNFHCGTQHIPIIIKCYEYFLTMIDKKDRITFEAESDIRGKIEHEKYRVFIKKAKILFDFQNSKFDDFNIRDLLDYIYNIQDVYKPIPIYNLKEE